MAAWRRSNQTSSSDRHVERQHGCQLIHFMNWRDEAAYERDHEFTQEELGGITADEIASWFNQRAYGTDTPGRNDRPIHMRSNSLLYLKKALSWFMPNRHHQWNGLTNVGNPTRSRAVNDMIKRVKKFEARRQGAPSKARRPPWLSSCYAS